MLDAEALETLRHGKNLLAFSGGIDSTALYHLLKEREISFDLALVNYETREESDAEELYARELARRDGKNVHVLRRRIEGGDFEQRARRIRYEFFETLVREHGYDHLLTAHQLDDMLEWSLMQLCKGCGVVEFVGMQPVERRRYYTLVRPLLFTPKKRLLEYLREKDLRYFVDRSNRDERFTRNLFRHRAAAFLMEACADGIGRSFRYMLEDRAALLPSFEPVFRHEEMIVVKRPEAANMTIRLIDRLLKERGYLLSNAQKEEIVKKESVVVGGLWAVEVEKLHIWIAPYRTLPMPKKFKERCRRAKIPPKIRPYLWERGVEVERLPSEPLLRFSS
ncbi:tRNA lysidine(34) synthetase TilS [Hydrogenimonas sp.]